MDENANLPTRRSTTSANPRVAFQPADLHALNGAIAWFNPGPFGNPLGIKRGILGRSNVTVWILGPI